MIASQPWYCDECTRGRFPNPKRKHRPKGGYTAEMREQRMRHSNRRDALQRTVLMCAIEEHSLHAPQYAYLRWLLFSPPEAEVTRRVKSRINRKDEEVS